MFKITVVHLLISLMVTAVCIVQNVQATDKCTDAASCSSHGTCEGVDGSKACSCTGGYGGETCDTASCDINPCENGGACSVENSAIVCKCTSGHGGDRCELASGSATISGHFLLLTVVAVLAKLNLN